MADWLNLERQKFDKIVDSLNDFNNSSIIDILLKDCSISTIDHFIDRINEVTRLLEKWKKIKTEAFESKKKNVIDDYTNSMVKLYKEYKITPKECPICYTNEINIMDDHDSFRKLSCDHYICGVCFLEMMKANNYIGNIKCPQCRQPTFNSSFLSNPPPD